MPLIGATLEPFSESERFFLSTKDPRTDTDFDGLPDEYERLVLTDPLKPDADADPDQDGVSNLQEYNAGTDPFQFTYQQTQFGISPLFALDNLKRIADSDQDLLPDWWENQFGLNEVNGNASDDPDGDNRSNLDEYRNGTNPLQIENPNLSRSASELFAVRTQPLEYTLGFDTDGDGLPDWWERKYRMNPLIYDSDRDADSDGLTGLAEFLNGRDPNIDDLVLEFGSVSLTFMIKTAQPRLDSDFDGIIDEWEMRFAGSASGMEPSVDSDFDGFTNLAEYNAGTNPNVRDDLSSSSGISEYFRYDSGGLQVSYWQDSDLEGMPDWWELRYGFLVRIPDGDGNADHDLFSNLQEFRFGTNPRVYDSQRPEDTLSGVFTLNTGGLLRDTDDDGLSDEWELKWFGSLLVNGIEDSDGDGLNNAAELLAGTDPTNPASSLRGSIRIIDTGEVIMSWSSVAGRAYRVIGLQELVRDGISRILLETTATSSETTIQIHPASSAEFIFVELLE